MNWEIDRDIDRDIDQDIDWSGVLWDIYLSGYQSVNWEIDRELDWEIVLMKGLLLVASPSGFDW